MMRAMHRVQLALSRPKVRGFRQHRMLSDVEQRLGEVEGRLRGLQPMYGTCESLTVEEFSKVYAEWEYFVRRRQSRVSLEQLLPADGTLPSSVQVLTFARYLYHEVPIRLSHRGRDLDRLPYGLSHMEPIREVNRWYFQSFVAIRKSKEPETIEDCIALLPVLREILERHSQTLEHVARGIYHLKQVLRSTADLSPNFFLNSDDKKKNGWWLSSFPRLQGFLNTFNESRIGTRFLIAQLMELILQVGEHEGWLSAKDRECSRYNQFGHNPDNFVGLILREMDATKVVEHAVQQVSKESEAFYRTIPKIGIETAGIRQSVIFVPLYLETMVLELLKNSVRAVIETHGRTAASQTQLITVTICTSATKRLTIRVSDNGGGIKRSNWELAQGYLYTTAPPAYADPHSLEIEKGETMDESESFHPVTSVSTASPFAGYGYGLPITKCLAKYFHGEFDLIAQEGLGTSAYIFLDPDATSKLRVC